MWWVSGVSGQFTQRMSERRNSSSSDTSSMPSSAATFLSAKGSCAMNFMSKGLASRNISAPMLPTPSEPSVLPTRPTPMCSPRAAKPGGPERASLSLTISLPVRARMKVMMETATGRRTPSGVIASAMSASVQAATSTVS